MDYDDYESFLEEVCELNYPDCLGCPLLLKNCPFEEDDWY